GLPNAYHHALCCDGERPADDDADCTGECCCCHGDAHDAPVPAPDRSPERPSSPCPCCPVCPDGGCTWCCVAHAPCCLTASAGILELVPSLVPLSPEAALLIPSALPGLPLRPPRA